MKVLVTGQGGRAGSWAIRAEQLGAAIGAKVVANASRTHGCDIAVVVKRAPERVVAALRGMPWVYDVVDFYPQPESYRWDRDRAIEWVRREIDRLGPTAVIWPNRRMRDDCDPGLPGMVLPHHHRCAMPQNPIRPAVRRVGYEGEVSYLGRWADDLRAECARRGWEFVVNPRRLADLDIVVAFRECGGYVSRHWKSGVKLANAHGSGTPFVGQAESGYAETACGGEQWAEDAAGLREAFDRLSDASERRAVSDRFLRHAYPLRQAASDLQAFLRDVHDRHYLGPLPVRITRETMVHADLR